MRYRRMPIEIESPEQLGYDAIANNLSESSFSDRTLGDYGIDVDPSALLLQYGDHLGAPALREQVAADADALERRRRDRHRRRGGGAVHRRDGAARRRRARLVASPTTRPTSRRRGRSAPTSSCLELRFEDGWALDLDRLEAACGRETRLVSLTYPHNPTGAMIDAGTLAAVVEIVERHGRRGCSSTRPTASSPTASRCRRSPR